MNQQLPGALFWFSFGDSQHWAGNCWGNCWCSSTITRSMIFNIAWGFSLQHYLKTVSSLSQPYVSPGDSQSNAISKLSQSRCKCEFWHGGPQQYHHIAGSTGAALAQPFAENWLTGRSQARHWKNVFCLEMPTTPLSEGYPKATSKLSHNHLTMCVSLGDSQ